LTAKSPGLHRYWQSLLLLLLPACLIVATYLLLVQPRVSNEMTHGIVQGVVDLQARALDNSLGQLAEQLNGLTRQPVLRQALQDQDLEALERLGQHWTMAFSHVNRFVVLPLGELGAAGLGEHKDKLRNNIEKDMLHRAIKEDTPIIDFYRVDQQQLIGFARSVTAGNRKIGALMLTLEPAWLESQLGDLRSAVLDSGSVSVLYQLQHAQPTVIMGSPPAPDGDSTVSASSLLTTNPAVAVHYQVSDTVRISPTTLVFVAVAAAILVLAGVVALGLLRKQMAGAFEADASRLKRYLGERFTDEAVRPDLKFASLNNVVEGFDRAYTKFREKFDVRVKDSEKESGRSKVDTVAEDWKNPSLSTEMDVVEEAPSDAGESSASASIPPSHIFRAYDIRGVVGDDLLIEHASLIGQAIGSQVQASGNNSVVVARDGRLTSEDLQDKLVEGLLSSGCDVVDIGLVPVPVLYFAIEHLGLGSGVMVTGSHNTPDYNGFKVVVNGESLADEQISRLYEAIESGNFAQGQGALSTQDLVDAYIDRIAEDVVFASPMKIVLDCGNGAAGEVAPMLFASLGSEVIPMFADIDGNFPNHLPDPSVESNLTALVKEVVEQGADIGLAFDGDGDRMVAVTASGRIVEPDQLLMLFARDVLTRNPAADVVFDQKCSRNLNHLIAEHGGRPVMWKSGHSRIKQKMAETGALLGGEYSGHYFFKERWFGFDDGLYSGARLVEMLTLEVASLDEVIDQLPLSASSPEISIPVEEQSKADVVARLQQSPEFEEGEITTLDGVKVDFSEGWGLVRASNTSARLTARFEADSEEDLQRIMAIFERALSAQGLTLP